MKKIYKFLEDKEIEYFLNKSHSEIYRALVKHYIASLVYREFLKPKKRTFYARLLRREILNKYGLTVRGAKYVQAVPAVVKPLVPVVNLPKEEWLDIEGHYGQYRVSSHGRVSELIDGVYMLKNQNINNGYKSVSIKGSTMLVHRLVAQAFMSNPNNHPYVDHINMERDFNHICNLRWCTPEQNTLLYPQQVKPILERSKPLFDEIKRLNGYTSQ